MIEQMEKEYLLIKEAISKNSVDDFLEEFLDWLNGLDIDDIDVNELLELYFRIENENKDIADEIIDAWLADSNYYICAIIENINEEMALKVIQKIDCFKDECIQLIAFAAKKLLDSEDEEKISLGYETIKMVAYMEEQAPRIVMGLHSIEDSDEYRTNLAINECMCIYGKALIDNIHNEFDPIKGIDLLHDALSCYEERYFVDDYEYNEYLVKVIKLLIDIKNYNAAYNYLLELVDFEFDNDDKEYVDISIDLLNKIKDFLDDEDKAHIDEIIDDLNDL